MGSIHVIQHESSVLRDNPMGDPHQRELPVFLPPGYDPARKEGYPVIFLLAGWSGRGAFYLNESNAFTPKLQDELTRQMAAGEMPAAIVVFPDGTSRFGCSQYVNSPANGRYMDYVADELVDWVDGEFHTKADRNHRGVIGHSSGGFGAMVLGMLRSDRFSAIMSSAGDSWYEHSFCAPIPAIIQQLEKSGGVVPFVESFMANPNPFGLVSGDEIVTMLALSMCPLYAPNLDEPFLKGDLYFDLKTGERIAEVWNKFLEWDPVHMVEAHLEELRSLCWIHLEAGSRDEYGLQLGHRQFAARLTANDIDHVMEEYPGKHGGHHWRMPRRIARMLAHIQ